jgi:hypothetical protein
VVDRVPSLFLLLGTCHAFLIIIATLLLRDPTSAERQQIREFVRAKKRATANGRTGGEAPLLHVHDGEGGRPTAGTEESVM